MYNFDLGCLGYMKTQNLTRRLMFDFCADIYFFLLLVAVFNQGRKKSFNSIVI